MKSPFFTLGVKAEVPLSPEQKIALILEVTGVSITLGAQLGVPARAAAAWRANAFATSLQLHLTRKPELSAKQLAALDRTFNRVIKAPLLGK